MRKTDKKIDNAMTAALTEVCDIALKEYQGFKWLTHFANYNYFPGSLSVVCVYDTNDHLATTDREGMGTLIKQKLAAIDVKIKDIHQHISFDTEENCNNENNGKWHERFK